MCRENNVRLNNDSMKWHSTLYSFWNFAIRQYDDSTNWHWTTWRFGKTTIRWNDVSGKWCGPELLVEKKISKTNKFTDLVFQWYLVPESTLSHFLYLLFLANQHSSSTGSRILWPYLLHLCIWNELSPLDCCTQLAFFVLFIKPVVSFSCIFTNIEMKALWL